MTVALQPSLKAGKVLSVEYRMPAVSFGLLHSRAHGGITVAALYPQSVYLYLRALWPPERASVRLGLGDDLAFLEVQVPLTQARYLKLIGEAGEDYAMPHLGTETLVVPGHFVRGNAACVRRAISQRAYCGVAVMGCGGVPEGSQTTVYAYENVSAHVLG